MQEEKVKKIIEAVKSMTDHEADILQVFISGIHAGKQLSEKERGKTLTISVAERVG